MVTTARSLLAVGPEFFASDSPHIRTQGAEVCGRSAMTFVQVVIEAKPLKSLTVSDSYTAFQEFCGRNGLVLVERSLFEDLVAKMIKEQYGLGLRHDVPNAIGKQQRGWRGVGIREGTLDLGALTRN